MAEILYGAPLAELITEQTRQAAESLCRRGIRPCLAILRAGAPESGRAYEQAAIRRCRRTGIETRCFELPDDPEPEELEREIRRINADRGIHGCLLMRPLPGGAAAAADCLLPQKDVDGCTTASLGALISGGDAFAPCTAAACMELLSYYGISAAGARAAVIGRSPAAGIPIALLLQRQNATVTVCHRGTRELAQICRGADIIVAAAGSAELLRGEHFSPGQTVIDVGINFREDGSIAGDVMFSAAAETARAVSPVPGGVGAVTTAILARNTVRAAERSGA